MNFMTPCQSFNRLGVFHNAKEQAAADSVNTYLVVSRDEFDCPLFNEELEDIDHVNRLMNVHNIFNEFYLKATYADDTIAKIDSLSKYISEQGTLGVLQTMSPSEDYDETTMYVKFKFSPSSPSESIFFEKGSRPRQDNRPPYRKDGGSSNKQERSDSQGRQPERFISFHA